MNSHRRYRVNDRASDLYIQPARLTGLTTVLSKNADRQDRCLVKAFGFDLNSVAQAFGIEI